MSQNGVQFVDKGQHFCKPPELIETYFEDASSESDGSNDSIQSQTWAEVPITTNPYVTVNLKASSGSDTLECDLLQPSWEELETPVLSPRVLLPFKSLSLLESPSDIEKPAIADISAGVVKKKSVENVSIIKERESTGFFFSNVTTPKPFLPLTPINSDGTWSDSDESSHATLVQTNVERNLKSQFLGMVKQEGSMMYIKHIESPMSETQSKDKAPKNDILQQVETQTSGLFRETPCSETDMSELQPFDIRPELLCGFDSISKLDSPIQKVKGESGNLSTYIERRDSLLEGLVADGGTRDFALWFDRLGPGLHCNQDFHTETGIFKQDFWHNPFARSKSFDKYLGLTAED